MYPPGMYPPPPHMFGSAAAGPYTMDPPTPQGKPPADVVGKTEEVAEKGAEQNSGVDDAKKEGDNPASEANVKASEEKGEESKEQPEPSDMSIDTNKKTPGIPSVTKDKMGLKGINPADITNATPATMCETMDDITPSAFMNTDDFKHGKSVGGPTPMSIYQSHGKPVYYQHQTPEGASPFQSIGSFSAITKAPMDPMSASHYFASAYKGGPPGSSGGLKGMGMPPPGMMMPPGYSPHVYQYQHFDPRSHIEHPMPVKSRSGMPADYIVPPTVHMPSATSSGVSPLAGYSAMKPDGSKTSGTKGLKSDKGSPLELLSSVTGSPLPLVGNIIHQPGMSSLPINEMQYTYDPDAPAAPDDDADTPSKKPSSLVDLMLTAANTIDVNESKKAKRRKLSDGDVKDVKKKLGGVDTSGMGLDSECIIQAQQASQLAEQALARPRLCKRLLLSMALVRTNPRTPPSCYPSHGTVLADRFHWAAYPPLDSILRKNMKRYYELSTDKCQSRDQQEFNNRLVHLIRKEATKYGWEFDEKVFDDKKIRDRIRCFYKTHIQNAKKRLKTMLKNPEKKANIKALAAHYHLIEEKGQDEEGDEYPEEDKVGHYRNDGIRLALSKSASSDSERLPGVGFQNSRSGGRKRTASTKYTEEA